MNVVYVDFGKPEKAPLVTKLKDGRVFYNFDQQAFCQACARLQSNIENPLGER